MPAPKTGGFARFRGFVNDGIRKMEEAASMVKGECSRIRTQNTAKSCDIKSNRIQSAKHSRSRA